MELIWVIRARVGSSVVRIGGAGPVAIPDEIDVHLIAGKATPMDDERIEARWFTAPEVTRLIRAGTIDDAKTIIGFFAWRKGPMR